MLQYDESQLVASGLLDPASADVEQRRELLDYLIAEGCDLDEMIEANARGRLFALAGDRLIHPGRDTMTLREAAEAVGLPIDDVKAIWRAFGLVDDGGVVASAADVEAIRHVGTLASVIGIEASLAVARVIAGSMSRIADALSTAVRTRIPALSIEGSGSEVETARTFGGIASFVPPTGRVLDTVFRRHLEGARMHFEATSSWDVMAGGGVNVAVGFADVSRFTEISAQLRFDELANLLSRFEEVGAQVVGDHGARLVKFIGDAVMWVSATPETSADVASTLIKAARDNGVSARAGVTMGTVLALDGDYFGPVVNLAARLVSMASPDEVLLDGPVTTALTRSQSSSYVIERLGPRTIRGFSDPVEVARLGSGQADVR